MQTFPKLGKLLAIALCCVLFLFMSVEIAHAHPLGAPDSTHCPLCVAAHVAMQSASLLAACILLAAIGKLVDRDAAAGFSVIRSARRIRPPPAGSAPLLLPSF